MWKPAVLDAAHRRGRASRSGSIGYRYGEEGLGQVEPRPRRHRPGAQRCTTPATARPSRSSCRASTPRRQGRATTRRGVPVRRVGDRARHHGARPDARAVRRAARPGCRATWPTRLRRPDGPGHPGLAGGEHRRSRPRRSCGWPASGRRTRSTPTGRGMILHGRRHQPLVPLRPDLPRDAACSRRSPAARAATAAAGRTTSARRRSGRSWASSTWPSRSTGTARRGT